MSGWDSASVSFIPGGSGSAAARIQLGVDGQPLENAADKSAAAIELKLLNFLRTFIDQNSQFIYRDQLRANILVGEFSLTVDLRHLQAADPELADELVQKPAEYLSLFESAARRLAATILQRDNSDITLREVQLILKSGANIIPMRKMNTGYINKLVKVWGIVSSASAPSAKSTELHLFCRGCRHVKIVPVSKGFSGIQFPRSCENPNPTDGADCPMDPYVVNVQNSHFVDQQILKLQESPDMVPVGELPRHMLLTADRYLANKVTPGTRVTVLGIYDVFSKQDKSEGAAAQIRTPYIRVVGMEIDMEANTRGRRNFTAEEEAQYMQMARRPDILRSFSQSIAPSIYGNEDIKKSIACLLLGGSKKILPDGMRLRGDINVLLLGDPGTAKSQLLKFVEKVSPIAVYTSGKGSSAAGLTASVIRDPTTREFYLEAGAMVLADGGVVCIDEFDKMREEDRVAIHEAMEQQTISIAKAGITTVLNSRSSVLAAANPVFGRYDDMHSPGENIDFQTTILSRFDMIYILRDEHNQARDETLAKHVVEVHRTGRAPEANVGEYDVTTMRGFINYCKTKCAPRLSQEAAEKLGSHFVEIRSQVQQYEAEAKARSSIPITIRQLEAIIRISESLAKMSLSPVATEQHVDEAIRLFRVSTYAATRSGYVSGEGMLMSTMRKEIGDAQEHLRRRLPIGSKMPERAAVEYLRNQGYSEISIQKALHFMTIKNSLQYIKQGKVLVR